MNKISYINVEHTADAGFVVFSESFSALFVDAALVLTDFLAQPCCPGKECAHEISVSGQDMEELFINWLREILYLWNGQNMLATDIEIRQISATQMVALVCFRQYLDHEVTVKNDVKAVTYHEVQVREENGRWRGQVIVDM